MVSPWKCFVLALILSFSGFARAAASNEEIIFKNQKITLGDKTFVVKVAKTQPELERGLMLVTKLGDDEGMLFVFNNEETRFFWMKNTLIDLSIGFFDKNKTLIDVQEMKSGQNIPDSSLPSYGSAKPAMYALEMNKGWFDKNKIKMGSKLKIYSKVQ